MAFSQIQEVPEPYCRHHTRSFRLFPVSGQAFVLILGKTMIQRTWERAKLASSLDYLVVATDDEKIGERCQGFGANAIMTSKSCRNGIECCNEALEKLDRKYDIVVNIQGDEPLIEPGIIDGRTFPKYGIKHLVSNRSYRSRIEGSISA